MMDLETIMQEVYRVYPKTKKEQTCWQEKQRRDELRKILKNRLIEQNNQIREEVRGEDL